MLNTSYSRQMSGEATRRKILDYLAKNPGTHYSQIMRDLEICNGTLDYNLHKLLCERAVASKRVGQKKYYFPEGVAKRTPTTTKQRILRTIRRHPGCATKELSERLDLPEATTSHHTCDLRNKCEIIKVRRGRNTFCVPVIEDILG